MGKKTKNSNFYHAPLNPNDTEKQTVGCRHTQPVICAKNSMEIVCAFVRKDGICLAPPASWKKQFNKLQNSNEQQIAGP